MDLITHILSSYLDIINGAKHRANGPAIITHNGYEEWWWEGMAYRFDHWIDANIILTDEEKLMMKLAQGTVNCF